MNNTPLTIELFLVDGKADGMITAEIPGWTGHFTLAPRSKMPQLVKRDEAKKTGIYFLVRENPDRPRIYIGESNKVDDRLREHHSKNSSGWGSEREPEWEKVCFLTNRGSHFTKTHAQYLESRLLEITKSTDRATLANKTTPTLPSLSESGYFYVEDFINKIRLILPALGMDFLSSFQTHSQSDEVIFEFKISKHDIKALATVQDDKFIVLKGSTAQPKWIGTGTGDVNTSAGQQHTRLFKEHGNILQSDDGLAVFAKDVRFGSPSAAAEAVSGMSSNGRKEWKVKGTNKTFGEWDAERLNAEDRIANETQI